jgi:hypothetical protein
VVNRALRSVVSTVENNLDALENMDVAIRVAGIRDQGRIVLRVFSMRSQSADRSEKDSARLPTAVSKTFPRAAADLSICRLEKRLNRRDQVLLKLRGVGIEIRPPAPPVRRCVRRLRVTEFAEQLARWL